MRELCEKQEKLVSNGGLGQMEYAEQIEQLDSLKVNVKILFKIKEDKRVL